MGTTIESTTAPPRQSERLRRERGIGVHSLHPRAQHQVQPAAQGQAGAVLDRERQVELEPARETGTQEGTRLARERRSAPAPVVFAGWAVLSALLMGLSTRPRSPAPLARATATPTPPPRRRVAPRHRRVG